MPGLDRGYGIVLAAESLTIDGLASDPKQFRAQVDQIIAKVDRLIEKLRGTPTARAIALDLMQTRDNILREISKIEAAPGDAKWTSQDMRESVLSMLRLLKDQYDKAAGMAG
jgi:hypothetical protein